MTASETKKLIAAAGGDTAFARILGLQGGNGFQQRVNNWKRRGIPSAVVLEHYDTLQRLRGSAPRGTRTAPDAAA